MFKKPQAGTNQKIQFVNLTTLGRDKKVTKGEVLFVPLVGCDPQKNGVNLEELKEWYDGIIPLWDKEVTTFEMRSWAGVISTTPQWATARHKWIDTGLRKAEGDDFDDPCIPLGLTEYKRKSMPGLFGNKGSDYPDKYNSVKEVTIPVLWDVTTNVKGHIEDGSGTLAMLTVNENQYLAIGRILSNFQLDETDWKGPSKADNVTQPWIGTCVVRLDKDTARKVRTYEWHSSESIVLNSHIAPHLAKAHDMLNKHVADTTQKYAPYLPIIERFENDEISYLEAQQLVVASIVKPMLTIWQEPFEDNTESILSTFDAVVSKYSVAAGAGVAAAFDAAKTVSTESNSNSENPF